MPFVITIDGPSASGKSSIARRVAAALGATYVNTGNMYRAVTWAIVRSGIAPQDEAAVTAQLSQLDVQYRITDGQIGITLDGHLLSDADLNAEAINGAVSYVARVPAVRSRLVADQQGFAALGDLIMEGRDIGTKVFPASPHKFYVDADELVRSQRRAKQGFADQQALRDKLDTSRTLSPLEVAPGAIVIDNSHITLDEAVHQILTHLQAQGISVP
jgi:CMP/dCMP kinase